jgi:DNA-binding CsgD family transcriptional regulator/PAS domain-containing protein
MLTPQFKAALDTCYASILDPRAWSSGMHALALAAGADAACLYAERAPELRLRLPASPAYHAFLEDFIKGDWWQTDHRAQRGWPRLRGGGKVLVEHDLISETERRSMPVYNELYVKHDLTWWAAVSFRVDGQDWAMPLLRREQSGPFSAQTQSLLPVSTHLARLVGLARDMMITGAQDVVQLFEAGCRPALVLDPFGRCLAANTLAEAMLGRDLLLSKGRLHAADPTSDRHLQDLIRTALRARSMADLPVPVTIRRNGLLPIIIDAVATPSSLHESHLNLHSVLLLTDLEQREKPNGTRLRQVFGLTLAEAKLAEQLVQGRTLGEASDHLQLSLETARTQLKSMFARTRTNRQTDLVRLLDRAATASRQQ